MKYLKNAIWLLPVIVIVFAFVGCKGGPVTYEGGVGPSGEPTVGPTVGPTVEPAEAPTEAEGGPLPYPLGVEPFVPTIMPPWRGARMYGGEGIDTANAVAVGRNGNVYVAGTYDSGKILLLAYSPNGDLLWEKKELSGEGKRVVLDSEGNIYIVGDTSENMGGTYRCEYKGMRDIFIAKYKLDGTLDWTCQLGSARDDFVFDAKIDGLGSIYLAGATAGAAVELDAIVLSFSTATKSWQPRERFGTPNYDAATAIVYGGGPIYVAGITRGCLDPTFTPCNNSTKADNDVFVGVIYTEGTLPTKIKQFGTSSNDNSYGLGIDEEHIYVAGITDGNFIGLSNRMTDFFISKRDIVDFTELKTEQFNTPKYDDVHGLTIYLDSGEPRYRSTVVFGDTNCEPLTRSTCDILVVKYNSGLNKIWHTRLGTQEGKEDVAHAAAATPDGRSIYVVGDTYGDMDEYVNKGYSDIFVLRLGSIDGVKM